jgi:hypothetical protein
MAGLELTAWIVAAIAGAIFICAMGRGVAPLPYGEQPEWL